MKELMLMHDEMPEPVAKYFERQPPAQLAMLHEMRDIILSVAPDAEQTMTYGVPAFRLHGPLVAIAGFKSHCGLYPLNETTLESLKDKLQGFSITKGTVRFPVDQPLPVDIVTLIVQRRVSENRAANDH